ncbi:MAG: hypothetical protein QXP36_07510 [Conexivisphaerales archaeon]
MSVGLTNDLPVQGVLSFPIPASAAAGTVINAQMQLLGPNVPPTTTQTVPSNEVWHILDIFTQGVVSGGADGQIVLTINGIDQPYSISVSNVNISLLTRFTLPQSIPIGPNSTISFKLILSAASGSSAVTQLVYVKLLRRPIR